MRKFVFLCVCALAAAGPWAAGQEEGAPPPKVSGVGITFLPPPMEGALSLGVYAKGGKLIRTLRKGASAEKDFTVGLNGLITRWDGKDDAGVPAPPGRYAFRGYCVGSLEVTGEAFHGNDWITDEESPRIGEVVSIQALPDDRLGVNARLADGAPAAVVCDANGAVTRIERLEPFAPVPDLTGLPLMDPVSACAGRDQSVWVIDRAPSGVEVKQYSHEKELLRHLAIEPGEPEPKQITASLTKETVYLLETKPGRQVVRGLTLDAPSEPAAAAPEAPKHSVWKTFLTKQILAGVSFAEVAGRLGRKQPFKAEEKMTVRLLPNPLFQDAATSVDLQIGFDEKGSYLRTADGLFLWPLTETPRLRWVAFGHDGNSKALTIFQSDGAVVEEFRVRKLANMMAFDAGDYELKR